MKFTDSLAFIKEVDNVSNQMTLISEFLQSYSRSSRIKGRRNGFPRNSTMANRNRDIIDYVFFISSRPPPLFYSDFPN